MLQAIKDNAYLLMIAVLTVILVVMGISLMSTKASLASTQEQLTTAQANQLVLQADLDTATELLKAAEIEKERLRLDAELVARSIVVRERERNAIATALQDTQAQAAAIIEDSDDEAVNTWANTDVPDDLNRLLEHTAYCANRDNHQDKVCAAARGTDGPVQGASLYRSQKPRSL